jgi:hypothetical protein
VIVVMQNLVFSLPRHYFLLELFFLLVSSIPPNCDIDLPPVAGEERRGLSIARDARAAMGRASFC